VLLGSQPIQTHRVLFARLGSRRVNVGVDAMAQVVQDLAGT
jgi:hypothetical protein